MFDLKVINSVLDQMEEERGIKRERLLDAIEQALATAYKKEFGRRGQIIRASFDINTGTTTFNQIKIVVNEDTVDMSEAEATATLAESKPSATAPESLDKDGEFKLRFDPEKHILINNARLIKKDVALEEELCFPLESKADFSRIAAQTAKQVIIQKIREAEKESALNEFGQKEGNIVLGHVQRFERGNLYIDLGRVTGIMPYDEQIPGERYRPGERIRALLISVEETARGIFLKLSRAHPDFLEHLFAVEVPELQSGTVKVRVIAREAGSRSKIAVATTDEHIDPVGSLVGQRGVRVSTVMSELGGEKIDIIEWSADSAEFIEDALSPAQVLNVTILDKDDSSGEESRGHARVEVAPDQQSLAIGRGGQNVRLAAKLTGWKIDIFSARGEELAEADEVGNVAITDEVSEVKVDSTASDQVDTIENEAGTIAKNDYDPLADADRPTEDRDLIAPDRAEDNVINTPEKFDALLSEAETEDEIQSAEAKATAK